jgi:formamidopyrimidine-DNA glycosylase
MPELPEVETVTKGIKPYLEGFVISTSQVLRPQLRIKIPKNFRELTEGSKILVVKRRAKYILISLDNNYTIIIHLGMSGRLTIQEIENEKVFFHHQEKNQKHDHLIIELESGIQLKYNDTRKFGLITITETNDIEKHKLLAKLGVEPFDNNLTAEVFHQLIKPKNKTIKSVLLDATIIVGIGNIYACEALFSSGIHPETIASMLKFNKAKTLLTEIKKTLKKAIKAGGSTLKDYSKADGSAGYFQHNFYVYARENQPCKTCKSTIIRIKQNGRSSFLCPKCQKQ